MFELLQRHEAVSRCSVPDLEWTATWRANNERAKANPEMEIIATHGDWDEQYWSDT